jgi:Ca2+-binding RTX toxin-like protein
MKGKVVFVLIAIVVLLLAAALPAFAKTIHGHEGGDILRGTKYADRIFGAKGKDSIFGWEGGDDLRGNAGSDTIHGGKSDDYVKGARGTDRLNGNDGNDSIWAWDDQEQRDLVNGGPGYDRAYVGTNDVVKNVEKTTLHPRYR